MADTRTPSHADLCVYVNNQIKEKARNQHQKRLWTQQTARVAQQFARALGQKMRWHIARRKAWITPAHHAFKPALIG